MLFKIVPTVSGSKYSSDMHGHSEYLIASHEVLSQFTVWPCSSKRRWFVCIWSPLGIDTGLYSGRPYQVTWQPNLPRLVRDLRVTFITVNCVCVSLQWICHLKSNSNIFASLNWFMMSNPWIYTKIKHIWTVGILIQGLIKFLTCDYYYYYFY